MSTSDVYFLYGSATGTAQSIVHLMFQDAATRKINAHFHSLNEVMTLNILEQIRVAVIVCATTGNGDVPENAAKFFRHLKMEARKSAIPDTPRLLAHLNYAVLCLGDTNYDKFCNAGRTLDQLLEQCGAVRFQPRGEADDAVGLDQVVEPWTRDLWNSLSTTLPKIAAATSSVSSPEPVRSSTARSEKECVKQQVHGSDFMYVSANGPFVPLRITAARRMSSSDSNKAVYWLQLGASDTARSKHAEALWSLLSRVSVGDAVALRVPNEVSDVTAIIEHCGAQEGDLLTNEAGHPFGLHICTPCTVRDCLTYMVDLNNITAAVLRVLASHASDAAEQSKLQVFASQQGAQQFRMQVTDQKLSVADILTTVAPSSRPNIRALIAALSPFTPRYYSLSNDPFSDVISSHPTVVLEPCSTVSPGSVTDLTQRFSEMQLESMKKDLEECKLEFIFSVVRGVSPPPHRRNIAGLCTTHLERLIADYQTNPGREVLVPAFATPTHEFKLPPSFSDVSKCPPVILIAAGTGVSPWRSFLQRRETLLRTSGVLPAATAPWWLFFGCRVAQKEDIIHDAIEHWRRDGVLAQALVACSQDTHADGAWYGGRYVQDDVYENRKEIRRLLVDAGAYIYVCGDARGMVRDVHRVLVDVISDDGRVMSDAEARAYLTEMMNTGRYQRESWTQL